MPDASARRTGSSTTRPRRAALTGASRRRLSSGWSGQTRRHLLIVVVVAIGVVGRIHAWSGDQSAQTVLSATQHITGIATAVCVYVLLRRWAVWRWLAALATVPALCDPQVWALEQADRLDGVFAFVIVVGVLGVGWRSRRGELIATWTAVIALAALLAAAIETVSGPAAGPRADLTERLMSHSWVPGAPLLIGLALGTGALLGVGRAAGSALQPMCWLLVIVPAAALVGVAVSAGSDWTGRLPGVVLWPAAGALGLTALLRGRRGHACARPQIDDVDLEAMAGFDHAYGHPVLGPIVVVIAAYNEATGLPKVLSALPGSVHGLDLDVIVVDDGSTDETAQVARSHGGCYLASASVNRGQGAAMRLAYRLARDHGAGYIVSTDADAQYDTGDIPALLTPILEGRADFVTGSRRLGHHISNDRFRRAGVHVFAWGINWLTGEQVSDTSFGLRAMRAEVSAQVTLNQPQYQSSELMLGVHSHGFRIAEVPATMHLRAAGTTKKGRNLVYGSRYARVVLGTWWREGAPAPAGERASAVRER